MRRGLTRHVPLVDCMHFPLAAGCLMLIPNYTGDRLNFGLAAERAQGEGIRIATHVIGEDCALTTSDKSAGRRGLTGIPVTIKVAPSSL